MSSIIHYQRLIISSGLNCCESCSCFSISDGNSFCAVLRIIQEERLYDLISSTRRWRSVQNIFVLNQNSWINKSAEKNNQKARADTAIEKNVTFSDDHRFHFPDWATVVISKYVSQSSSFFVIAPVFRPCCSDAFNCQRLHDVAKSDALHVEYNSFDGYNIFFSLTCLCCLGFTSDAHAFLQK